MKVRTWCLALAAGALAAATAQAQNYPNKPVRVVVGTTAGSSMDVVARGLAERLSRIWGQSVIVDNRAGAAGLIGEELVAKSAPDGYTLLYAAGSLAARPARYRKLPFDVLRDFEPVTQVVSRGEVLTVNPQVPAKDTRELIALAKARPGQIRYSTGGVGSASQMGMELFNLMAGIKLTNVPYKGGPQAINDVVSGTIEAYFGGLLPVLPMIKEGRLRALGTSGPRRSSILPDVQTMAEAGVPGFEFDNWNGIFVRAGTPPEIVEKIAADIRTVVSSEELKSRFASQGIDLVSTSPADFKKYFAAEVAKWPEVVKAANIAVQ
ncbi:tripartite tricarboxylate transporter substrate binding protein [Pigmentiphaga soli]|uniref:Tripartite tricarboxylate transporter substrate binding protein n=1 Tax=Pigmentiphaga soli TaxID=1007095 RepID=A0ABP8H3Y1_9BURK